MSMPIRLLMLAILSVGHAACAPAPVPTDHPPRPVVLATFDGEMSRGEFRVVVRDSLGNRVAQFATDMPLPTAGSGPAGTTTAPSDSILLHQTAPRSLDSACNVAPYDDTGVPSPFLGVCVPMQMISGYAMHYVLNAYMQLTSLSYCGATMGGTVTAYVKDPSNALIGVDNTLGLWSYGHLRPMGAMGDRASRNWFFQTPEPGAMTCFRFRAVAMGEPFAP